MGKKEYFIYSIAPKGFVITGTKTKKQLDIIEVFFKEIGILKTNQPIYPIEKNSIFEETNCHIIYKKSSGNLLFYPSSLKINSLDVMFNYSTEEFIEKFINSEQEFPDLKEFKYITKTKIYEILEKGFCILGNKSVEQLETIYYFFHKIGILKDDSAMYPKNNKPRSNLHYDIVYKSESKSLHFYENDFYLDPLYKESCIFSTEEFLKTFIYDEMNYIGGVDIGSKPDKTSINTWTFWMVKSEFKGKENGCSVMHPSYNLAKEEANRLAKENPGKKFYLLQAIEFDRTLSKSEELAQNIYDIIRHLTDEFNESAITMLIKDLIEKEHIRKYEN